MADVVFSSRAPSSALTGLIARLSGFSSGGRPSAFHETAELVFPIIFNLGQAWEIQLGADGKNTRQTSFTAGLFPGPVTVSCDAGAELLQVDLTPLGAARLFGGAAADLAAQVADLSAVDQFDGAFGAIHDQLYCLNDWAARFDLVERFLAPRFRHEVSPHVQQAWRFLARGRTVAEAAAAIGWSSRHLSTKFRQQTGIRPITAARMLRFQRARNLAFAPRAASWAGIAIDAGYSDQAHLIREFRDLAGLSPKAWANSVQSSQPRLEI